MPSNYCTPCSLELTPPVTREKGANESGRASAVNAIIKDGWIYCKCSEKAGHSLRTPPPPSSIQHPAAAAAAAAFMSDHNHDAAIFCAHVGVGWPFPRVTVQYWAVIVRSYRRFAFSSDRSTKRCGIFQHLLLRASGPMQWAIPSLPFSFPFLRACDERAHTCVLICIALYDYFLDFFQLTSFP